jgi:hypothetical protein
MGAPPQPGFGGPQPGGFPPPQPQYPPAGGFGVAPQQDLPGPLDNMARGIPSSAPGTIFGFPVSRLRDPALQKKALFLCGAALIIAVFLPFSFSPFVGSWSLSVFHFMIWPLLAGGAYLFVAAAPPSMQQSIPPVVLQWIPFGVSFIGISILGSQGGGALAFHTISYATLVFGLLCRIAQPNDQVARIIIAVGAVMMIWPWAVSLGIVFGFHGGVFGIIANLLRFLVDTLAVLCVLFVVPPQKLPPALQAVDAFGPLVCAVIILWIPLEYVFLLLQSIIDGAGLSGILLVTHLLIYFVSFFGVLMLTAPAAYEEAKRMFSGGGSGGGGGGGYPPPGGGYPPPGGGYPPPGGGYPPPGGGFPPPAGGGYPPPGGGYPA